MNSFFIQSNDASLFVYGIYDPWLVVLSFAIAAFTSAMALQIAGAAALIQRPWQRQVAICAGAVSLGGGIWSMHFVGMLAFDLCTPVQYDLHQTLLSLLPSLAASWVALSMLSRASITRAQLVGGGALVGAGIGTMHYSGMAAMQMAVTLRYDPAWFALSIVVAVGLAILALWIRFGLAGLQGRRQLKGWQTLATSGCVMGLAIACMHYIGMVAARFIAPPGFVANTQPSPTSWVALQISLVTVMVTIVVAIVADALLRYRQLYRQMRLSEVRLQAIVNTAANGLIMLDRHGGIQTFNPAAERMFGWMASEVLGKNASLLVQPEFGIRFNSYLSNHLRTGDTRKLGVDLDFEGLHKDGSPLPFRVAIGKVTLDNEPVFVGFITDTSERKAMEKALVDSELQFRSLLSHAPGMTFRRHISPGWPLVFTSEGALALTGWSADDFMASRIQFADLIDPQSVAMVRADIDRAIAQGGSYASEYQIIRKDGQRRWVMSQGGVVRDAQGQPRWFDGLVMDIHARREAEDALHAAKNRAELAAASKTAFLANMSHEIRTPMNAIIGFTELLLESGLNTLQRQHMVTVRHSAHSLLGLLNSILDTAKLEKGAVELEHSDFSLEELATRVLAAMQVTAHAKSLDLQFDYKLVQGTFFKGDALRIQQVLNNLLGNALKFTAQGFVKLAIFDDAGQVHITVQDTGIGIAADRIEKIFDPFSQADASMSRRFGGTGLGTTIARQLVELMGGTLWVTSTPDVGSVFHVRLPLAPGGRARIQHPSEPRKLPTLRILAVDDVPQNLTLLNLLLGNAGHLVSIASDGAQAISAWETDPFDMILMDVQMPGLDGLQATRQIRDQEQQQGLKATPIIALTASVLEQNRVATQEAGMDGFVAKPIVLSDLFAEMARVMGIENAAPSPPGSPFPPVTPPRSPIDWSRGIELWGSAQTLADAIRQLLLDQSTVGAQLGQHLQISQFDAAHQQVHRLRGATGNLCLTQLHALTIELERHILAQEGHLALAKLEQLDAEMQAIWSVLALPTAPEDGGNARQAVDHGEHPAIPLQSDDFRQLALGVAGSLHRGELDDDNLALLVQALRTAALADPALDLEDAVNSFEFRKAEQLVRELLDSLAKQAQSEGS